MKQLPWRTQRNDWHCVTGWSATDLVFEGISFSTLLKIKPIQELLSDDWNWLYCESADGYTVPIHREDLLGDDDAMLVFQCHGQPISPTDHGGPRLLLPKLFGWKSAKWVIRWRFLKDYQPGFWERLGCHRRGRHASGERFDARYDGIWKWIAAAPGLYRWAFGNQVWVWVMQRGGSLLGTIIYYVFPFLYQVPTSAATIEEITSTTEKKAA
jgi:DMSO/TMAO reductase YedYZ molybdopterin-dependent catalytic subunit